MIFTHPLSPPGSAPTIQDRPTAPRGIAKWPEPELLPAAVGDGGGTETSGTEGRVELVKNSNCLVVWK